MLQELAKNQRDSQIMSAWAAGNPKKNKASLQFQLIPANEKLPSTISISKKLPELSGEAQAQKRHEKTRSPEEAQKRPQAQKKLDQKPRKGPRKAGNLEKAQNRPRGLGKRPQKPRLFWLQKNKPRGMGRGPEAHKRPQRGHKNHCFEQVFQAGLQRGTEAHKRLKEATKAIVLSFSGRLAKRPRSPQKAQRGHKSHCFEQKIQAGLQRGPEAHKRLKEATNAIVLSKFFRQACKKAEKASVLASHPKKKLAQKSVKSPSKVRQKSVKSRTKLRT